MSAPAKLPGSLNANRRLDRWLRFNPDQTITVYTGKVEIGQGVVTAMAQIAAEELDVSLARVRMVSGDTALTPDEGHTSGSRSIDEGGSAMRYACAEARHLLLQEASSRLDIPADKLTVEDGVISGFDRIRKLSYWELPHAGLLDREATAAIKPKPAARHTIVGTSAARLDIPAKATGAPRFVHDLELPGMLFGRVVRPPSYDARLTAFDAEAVRKLPGVVAVVRDGNFIGIVAAREEQAVKARQAAANAAQWQETPLPTDDSGIHDYLQSRQTKDQVIVERADPAVSARATRSFEARYTRPYVAHASLGPSCALARVDNGRVEVWTHSQGVFQLRHDLAAVLDLPPEAILVHHAEGAGCYGHNGADDVALDAVLLARAVAGRPVQVQWMREDEFAWEPYGPAMVVKTRAALDQQGNIVDWALELWSNGHTGRPNAAKTPDKVNSLLAARHLENPIARRPQGDPPMSGGGGMARNSPATYDFPNERVIAHRVEEMPLRVSALRALGATANVFAIESFIDELAAAAGADPVEFRLRHMKDERARAVIELAAQQAGWRAGAASDGTSGRGIAFAQYKNGYGYLAVVIEIGLEPDLHVTRAVAAVDVGQAINPDGIINQTEGGIIQAISWTLKEQVRFDRAHVTTRTWEDYPILTFPEVPRVEVHLINRPDEAPLGAGEMAGGPVTAAIANALHHALGVRIRDLPLTRDRITAALT
ncbi:MAG: xanthine dehydrogenase family protein molybdopterin-binding subunit [Betaproteobacteria bacterium]|nr:xanthine dehydrogenase family protein molybdopterin-binding subunit [Betaproteobacteria bacterium]